MNTYLRSTRRCGTSRRFTLEGLESRLVLSTASSPGFPTPAMLVAPWITDPLAQTPLGSDLGIVGISPSAASTTSTSPATLDVIFDRPIDPFSLGIADIRVDQLQSDHSWSPFLNDGNNFLDESVDDSGTILQLSLTQSLPVGTYRLVLPAYSMIAGLDGSVFANAFDDQDLGHFAITPKGATLDEAVSVGPVSTTSPGVGTSSSSWSTSIGGSLDFTSNPLAVNLYKITVPQGHFWRFGAEVQSQRLGGSLQSAVTLFDSQGAGIRFSASGRPSTPNDAYLYAGLAAGTYYIGVSGAGNIPLAHYNGYNPVSGDPGAVSQSQPGGSYELKLSLDSEDSPTQLVESTLDFADPLSASPTGLTLVFNGILDPQTVRGQPTPGFVLTNQAGLTFALTIVDVNESTGQYTFLFDNTLPAGNYTLKAAAADGAKDLSGFTPVSMNQPTGVLMTFDVNSITLPWFPNDIGAFTNNVHQGVDFDASIEPGTAVTYRFVLTSHGVYHFESSFEAGQVELQFLGGGSSGALTSAGMAGDVNGQDLYFKAGVYLVSFRNIGSVPVDLYWSVRLNQAWDSFFDNGLGQSSALTLRMVDPSMANPPSAAIGLPSGPNFVPGASGPGSPAAVSMPPTNSNGGGATSTITLAASPSSSGGAGANAPFAITPVSTLVGRPVLTGEHVAVVGPAAGGATSGLASSGNGIPQGIGLGQSLGRASLRLSAVSRAKEGNAAHAEAEALPAVNGAIVFDPAAAAPKADEMVVATSDWLDKINELAVRLLSTRLGELLDDAPETGEPERIAMTHDETRDQEGKVEGASLGAPVAIGLFTMAAVRRYNKSRKQKAQPQTGHPRVIRGPHGRF